MQDIKTSIARWFDHAQLCGPDVQLIQIIADWRKKVLLCDQTPQILHKSINLHLSKKKIR